MPLRLGIIGTGSMGSVHTRVATSASDFEVKWVADPDEAARERVGSRYGVSTKLAPTSMDDVDAVIIASPTDTHAEWCFKAIEARVPFLVEKPVSTDLLEVEDIVSGALEADLAFTVGFVERFNPAVRTVDGIIDDPIYFRATRHSPYVERIRTGVGGDLMIHDLDLALRLMRSDPAAVFASLTYVHPSSDPDAEDISEAHIQFDSGAVASLSASRAAQRKVRTLTITNLEMTAEVNLMRQEVTIYRHVLTAPIQEDHPGYRQETVMEIPQISNRTEPLVAQLDHFKELVAGQVDPVREANGIVASHRALAACRRSAVEGRSIAMAST